MITQNQKESKMKIFKESTNTNNEIIKFDNRTDIEQKNHFFLSAIRAEIRRIKQKDMDYLVWTLVKEGWYHGLFFISGVCHIYDDILILEKFVEITFSPKIDLADYYDATDFDLPDWEETKYYSFDADLIKHPCNQVREDNVWGLQYFNLAGKCVIFKINLGMWWEDCNGLVYGDTPFGFCKIIDDVLFLESVKQIKPSVTKSDELEASLLEIPKWSLTSHFGIENSGVKKLFDCENGNEIVGG